MFQQNRYEFKRYSQWLFNFSNKFLLIPRLIYVGLMLFPGVLPIYLRHIAVIILTLLFAIILIKKEDEIKYIKPLVYTSRVKRTLVLYYILYTLVLFVLVNEFIKTINVVGIIVMILPYIFIYPVALILKPIEYAIKKKYQNEAINILNENPDLIKIGITGSYGKTTTKNIVTQILNCKYYTLMTPSSYNTPMGITRTIRESLKRVHEVFVCEMGADHVNDISYLMNMVKPKYGIVSSIGPQHLQTFGSIENIIKEKMQEIEMLPEDGVGFINLDNEYIQEYPINNICKVVSIAIHNEKADYVASDIKYSNEGSAFKVKIKNKNYKFETKLLGEHNISNILLGIALALELDIPIKDIQKAIKELPQVEHRLELKTINGFNFVDDAFNSNPSGSLYALKALKYMNGKRVIVTPGLIDLGKQENKINYDFGKAMLDTTDYVILVGKNQTKYIYKGLIDAGYLKDNILIVDKVNEAFAYIYKNFTTKDTILLENDLPDAFNN